MKLLEGKVAIVTGAARGIGKAIAMRFAEEGASVVFTDLKVDENFQNTEKELQALGVKAKGYASNAADFEDTAGVVAQIVKDFGRIDVLVNNAGITRDGLMMRMSEQQWDMVINVNLKSAFNFIHAVTPVMMKQKSGSIINMASVVGVSGNAGQTNYSASKAGLIGLAKSIAKELGPRGIRANAIAPGFIITDMTNALSDEVKAEWAKQIASRRYARRRGQGSPVPRIRPVVVRQRTGNPRLRSDEYLIRRNIVSHANPVPDSGYRVYFTGTARLCRKKPGRPIRTPRPVSWVPRPLIRRRALFRTGCPTACRAGSKERSTRCSPPAESN